MNILQKCIIVESHPKMAETLSQIFQDTLGITITPTDFSQTKADYLVFPFDSILRMDHNQTLKNIFQTMFPQLQISLNSYMQKYFLEKSRAKRWYCPMGKAILFAFQNHYQPPPSYQHCKGLIICPIMFLNQTISKTKNLYYRIRLVFELLDKYQKQEKKINHYVQPLTVAFTSGYTEGFSIEECAQQWKLAWNHHHDPLIPRLDISHPQAWHQVFYPTLTYLQPAYHANLEFFQFSDIELDCPKKK